MMIWTNNQDDVTEPDGKKSRPAPMRHAPRRLDRRTHGRATVPPANIPLLVAPRTQERRFPLSLAMRLLALFGLFIALTAGAGGAVMIGNARDAVDAEMRSALELGTALAREAMPGDATALTALGLRHLRFQREGAAAPQPDTAVERETPGWFVALIGVEPRTRRVAAPSGTPALLVVAEPWDEIAEVWEDMRDLGLTVLALAVLSLAGAALALRRALRPLARFEAGVERLRAGTYDFRFDGGGVPELRRLGLGIAALAVGLAEAERENRRLGRKLVSAQDDERRDLARDIHDELGAALFGIKVDAGRILRLTDAAPGNAAPNTTVAARDETTARARSILDTAEGVQRLSRRILTRLRPVRLDHMPLGEALAELVGEWTRRQPAIGWTLDLDEALNEDADSGAALDEALRLTVYRLVQELLVNALRHAQPASVAVSVRRDGDALVIRVADDGPGLPPHPPTAHPPRQTAGMAPRAVSGFRAWPSGCRRWAGG